jgi:hypothetical protein
MIFLRSFVTFCRPELSLFNGGSGIIEIKDNLCDDRVCHCATGDTIFGEVGVGCCVGKRWFSGDTIVSNSEDKLRAGDGIEIVLLYDNEGESTLDTDTEKA